MKKVLFLVVAAAALLFTSCKKEYTITVQSNNEEWGIVKGGGTYAKGAEISIEAIANIGYKFVSWQDDNTDNPRTITVKSNKTYVATFASGGGGGEEPAGAVFSVSATQKVYFSPGNLQWTASGSHAVAGGGIADGTWRFALNQWDTIGVGNSNVSSTYTGWIDLFGWGTSGYNNKYPYMTSTIYSDYGNGENDIAGTNYDWGVYNAIYNPKTNTTDAPGTWRTLTKEEWGYLLDTRSTVSNIRYAKSTIAGVKGLIIVPDNWNRYIYPLRFTNIADADYTTNNISSADWTKLEAGGCVFLPAAGYRYGSSVHNVGSYGSYWSTTYNGSLCAYYLYFDSSNLSPSNGNGGRYDGESVRLVRSAQ